MVLIGDFGTTQPERGQSFSVGWQGTHVWWQGRADTIQGTSQPPSPAYPVLQGDTDDSTHEEGRRCTVDLEALQSDSLFRCFASCVIPVQPFEPQFLIQSESSHCWDAHSSVKWMSKALRAKWLARCLARNESHTNMIFQSRLLESVKVKKWYNQHGLHCMSIGLMSIHLKLTGRQPSLYIVPNGRALVLINTSTWFKLIRTE